MRRISVAAACAMALSVATVVGQQPAEEAGVGFLAHEALGDADAVDGLREGGGDAAEALLRRAGVPAEPAAEAAAARRRHRHLDLHLVARPGLEVRGPDQGPVDPRRGNFEMVPRGDHVLDIEDRRHGAAHRLAVVD